MKRIKYLLLGLVASAFVFQSCSEDKMDDINKDVNNPQDVEAKYIITDMMVKSAFSVTGSDLAFYTSVYTELLGGAWNQMYKAQVREGEPVLASTYNNSWNTLYATLRNLNIIIDKCSVGGKEEGNYHALGMAQVLKAYNLAVLTDLFGDVPYSKGLNPNNSEADLDKQEDIYNEIFALLDAGIENLGKNSAFPSMGGQDIIYGGNVDQWTKTAYGLKARYTMRLSHIDPKYQEVIDYVNKSFTSVEDEFVMQDPKIPYPFYRFAESVYGLFASKTFYDIMKSNDPNDPRLVDYFPPVVETDDKGNVISSEVVLLDAASEVIQSQVTYSVSGVSNTQFVANAQNAIYMLSMHELAFLKAEAYARLGDEAQAITNLEEGIKLGLNKRQMYTYPNYNKVSNNMMITGEALLDKIAQSKYISFGEVEAIEAFNDIRRWKAMGENRIPLQHPDADKFPLRLTYGQSDVVSNPFIKKAFGDGTYVYTENVWWAGGTR